MTGTYEKYKRQDHMKKYDRNIWKNRNDRNTWKIRQEHMKKIIEGTRT
jgi:hypothetical protein